MSLYHEQQWGALCGVHTLNTLLQGPWISEIELSQIAQELDAMESQLLGGSVRPADEAGNVDGSGMFSSQVLNMALKSWDLSICPITSPDMRGVAEEPQREEAFICNLSEHWFTIRRVGDAWYNFNSIYPAPEALGTFYLAAYLASLRAQGYTIFVVRGTLPQPAPPSLGSQGQGRWYTPQEAKQLHESAAQTRQEGRAKNTVEQAFTRAAAGGGTMQLRSRRAQGPSVASQEWEDEAGMEGEDADLAAAIAASLEGQGGRQAERQADAGPSGAGGDRASGRQDRDMQQGGADELAAVLAASRGQGGQGEGGQGMEETDDDLAAALAASQEAELAGIAAMDPELAAALAVARAADRAEAAAARLRTGAGVGAGTGLGTGAGQVGSGSASQPVEPVVAPSVEPCQTEPDAADGVIELAFRLPGGSRVMRRFSSTMPTSQIYSFLTHVHQLPAGSIAVHTQFPRKEVPSSSETLSAAGLEHRQVLTVDNK